MRNSSRLRPRSRATGVIDRQQIAFLNLWTDKVVRGLSQKRFVIEPAVARAIEGHEMINCGQLRTNTFNSGKNNLTGRKHPSALCLIR